MLEPCVIVIPAWNEAATLGPLVKRAQAQFASVIVVDDGSTDETGVLAEAAGATVLRHPHNLGKGAALRTGLRHAREQGFRWAVTLDADGQHAPEDIPAFLDRAAATDCVLVVGDRMGSAREMPWLRRAANHWMSRQLSGRTNRPLPDSQCGFRLLQLEAWARLPLSTEHFEVESETLLAFITAGHRVEFVPIAVINSPRPSRIRPLPDSLRWLRWWRQSGRSASAPAGRALRATS